MMQQIAKIFLLSFAVVLPIPLSANSTAGPPKYINVTQIISAQVGHYTEYSNYKVIGICTWLHFDPFPSVTVTAEVEEYKPDFIVTVYNEDGDDPWIEAKEMIDPIAKSLGSSLLKSIPGFSTFEMTQGNVSEIAAPYHYDNLRTKVVDVIGNPMDLIQLPFGDLRTNTSAYVPYYQSDLDVLGTLGVADITLPESWNPMKYYIGKGPEDHWSYEFPRSMSIDADNDFKASVVAALHAADIVTNHNSFHTVKSVDNSCGVNCAVSNVIEETDDKNEKWQEIYPENKHIILGQNDIMGTSLGASDDIEGNGNYVFAVWRHYRGCVQSVGELIHARVPVSPTIKR